MFQIGILIFGIVILVRNKFSLTRKKVVTGAPAIFVGVMFIALLPLAFALGMLLGNLVGQSMAREELMTYAVSLDVGLIFLVGIIALVVGIVYGKPEGHPTKTPHQSTFDGVPDYSNYDQKDSSNPYQAPRR